MVVAGRCVAGGEGRTCPKPNLTKMYFLQGENVMCVKYVCVGVGQNVYVCVCKAGENVSGSSGVCKGTREEEEIKYV